MIYLKGSSRKSCHEPKEKNTKKERETQKGEKINKNKK